MKMDCRQHQNLDCENSALYLLKAVNLFFGICKKILPFLTFCLGSPLNHEVYGRKSIASFVCCVKVCLDVSYLLCPMTLCIYVTGVLQINVILLYECNVNWDAPFLLLFLFYKSTAVIKSGHPHPCSKSQNNQRHMKLHFLLDHGPGRDCCRVHIKSRNGTQFHLPS